MEEENSNLLNYLNVHSAYQSNAIPGKNSFTFLSKKTGTAQVWNWDGNTEEIKRVTNSTERIMSVYHSPSGEKTILGADHKGNEQQQLYLLIRNSKAMEKLIFSLGSFHYFGGWSPDETKITFSSNRRHPGYFDIYIYDFKSKEEKLIFETNRNCKPLCFTEDGENIIYSLQDTNIDNSLYILNIDTLETSKIGPDGVLSRYQWLEVVSDKYSPPELTKDGKRGYVLSDINRETLGVFSFDFIAPSKLEELFSVGQWDIEEIKLSPDETQLAYAVNEGGVSQLGIYNLAKKSHERVKNLPSGVINSLSWLNNDELLFCLKGAKFPGDIWKVATENMKSDRITFFGEKKAIQASLVDPELFTFASFDRQEIPYFYYGKRDTCHPVVFYVHGGPEHQSRSEYNPVIQFLVSKGIGVVTPNVRGSMGYGRTYVKLDDKRKRMDAVADLASLAKELVENHQADPKKIGIMGRSYGGFMVLAALAHYPEIWAAGVDIVGISHFKTFLENTGPWRRELRSYEYGSLEEDREFFEEIAPLNHTDKIIAPLLVFHGRHDTRVPVSEAEQIAKDLKDQDKTVELVIFEDEGHQTEKHENHIKMNSMIARFFRQYL